MMRLYFSSGRFAIACALMLSIFAHAAVPAVVLPVQNGPLTVLPDGTQFTVLTTEELSSKTATENETVTFKVAEDVSINGHIVIAAGTVVKGSVASVEQKGRMGKSGKLGLRIESTTAADGQKIKLRGSKNKAADDSTGSVIALTVLLSPFFLLKKGKSAIIKEGTKLNVYTDEEKKVRAKS